MKSALLLSALLLFSPSMHAVPIYLTSDEGRRLINESRHKADYWQLSSSLVTQRTQTLCSIASSVTVLNALGFKRPEEPEYYPYNYFNQSNFFNVPVSEVVSLTSVSEEGMTLENLTDVMRALGVLALSVHAGDSTLEEFRGALEADLTTGHSAIIINYDRTNVGQKGGGHFSPVAAYHAPSDRVLILDVARYKYAPSWISLEILFKSMSTIDSRSRKSRGWIQIKSETTVHE
ncbi:MAG: phytochelatin synthase family protein [Halioglobus sp.]